MKLDNLYHLEYSDYYLHLYGYIHNVSAEFDVKQLKKEALAETMWI